MKRLVEDREATLNDVWMSFAQFACKEKTEEQMHDVRLGFYAAAMAMLRLANALTDPDRTTADIRDRLQQFESMEKEGLGLLHRSAAKEEQE